MIEPNQDLAVSGHRPDKLGGYLEAINARLIKLGEWLIDQYQPRILIIGMALGFDQACARAAINRGVPFIAAIPHALQPYLWPYAAQKRWAGLLDQASEVVNIHEQFYSREASFKPWMLHARNEYMVDQTEGLISLWNGEDKGGIAACIHYAQRRGKPWENVWEKWLEISEGEPK